jgi:hypothetical protein
MSDLKGNEIIGAGLAGGLIGITTASILTSKEYFSEGRGALTGSANKWGAWFGLIFASMTDLDGNDVLRSVLLGSDLLVVSTAIAAKNVEMSRGRVRLISLSGFVGIVAGFGIDLLIEVDNSQTAMGIVGISSVAGLIMGASLTKDYDRDKDFAHIINKSDYSWDISPELTLKPDPFHVGKTMPSAAIRLNF